MPQTAFRDDCVARIKAHVVSGIANDTQRRDAIEAMAVCTAAMLLGFRGAPLPDNQEGIERIAARILGVDLT